MRFGRVIPKGGTDSVPGPARAAPFFGTLGRAGPLFIDYSYFKQVFIIGGAACLAQTWSMAG